MLRIRANMISENETTATCLLEAQSSRLTEVARVLNRLLGEGSIFVLIYAIQSSGLEVGVGICGRWF